MTTMGDLEKLRHTFRPQPINTLFVGESPPDGGTFFYKEDSVLYRSMKESFQDSFGIAPDFIMEFKAKCFFLDDLVLYPINKIKDEKQRNEHRRRGVESLARRMADYRPATVVILMCAIEEMVIDAMNKAGFSHVPNYVTAFPGRYHRERFRREMVEIIPKLPAVCPASSRDVHFADGRAGQMTDEELAARLQKIENSLKELGGASTGGVPPRAIRVPTYVPQERLDALERQLERQNTLIEVLRELLPQFGGKFDKLCSDKETSTLNPSASDVAEAVFGVEDA